MSQEKVEVTKMLCYKLEDIVEAKERAGADVIHWTLSDTDSTTFMYNWEIKNKPYFLKALAAFFLTLSLFSFLGVISSMAGVDKSTSVYFIAVHNGESVAGVTIFILITLGYVVYLTTWALFQMRLAGLMELVPHRTTPESLSFNVRRLTGFAAPLAFFYLGWINENGIKTGSYLYNDADTDPIYMPSAFSHFYVIANVDIIRKTFGTIFPVLLIILLVLFTTNIFNRVLVMLKLDKYQFGARIVTEEQLREGKRQLQRHRKHTERGVKRGLREEKINSSMSSATSVPISFSGMFGIGRSSNVDSTQKIATDTSGKKEAPRVREPEVLWGTVEKKTPSSSVMGGTSWKAVHATVVAPGYLHVYKDEKKAVIALGPKPEAGRFAPMDGSARPDGSQSSDQTAQVVDLRLIIDFSKKHVKSNSAELHLGVATTTIKLKFDDPQEMDKWRALLIEWKDFFVDFGKFYSRDQDATPKAPGLMQHANKPSAAAEMINPVTNDRIDMDHVQMDMEEGDCHMDSQSEESGSSNSRNLSNVNYLSAATKSPFRKQSPPKEREDDILSLGAKPAALEGWLEKKGGKMSIGAEYQKRFMRVHEADNTLRYYKSNKANSQAAGTIDLKLIRDITPYLRDGTEDYSRFNIDSGEKVYKFKATNADEGKKWIDGLNDWHDYFLMQM